MEPNNLSALAAALTSNFTPSKINSSKQLEVLKSQLLSALQVQDIQDILPGGLNRFDKIHLEAISRNTEKEVTPGEIAATSVYSVFRREVPVRTSQYEASVPKWAAGQAVDHTLGPFIDNFGKWYWFDFYKRVHDVTVARGSDLFLQIPIRGLLSTSQRHTLAAGSVWIRSQLISASAPAGAFTGLKIKKGEIQFKNPITISGGNSIIISGSEVCELLLELDQAGSSPALDTSTGDDAQDQTIQLPKKIKISCGPGAIVISEASDMALETYGAAYQFSKNNAVAPFFDAVLNRILIAYNNASDTFSPLSVASTLFRLSETATISGNYWALPVTISPIASLGEAAGIGAIAIKIKPGLKTKWENLKKGPVQLNTTYILCEPGRIAITAIAASGRASQKLNLWEENNPTKKVRSIVDLQYGKKFSLLYNSLSSGTETLIILQAAMQAAIDRPVSADKKRLNIHALAASVVYFEIKNQSFIYLQALNMMQQLIAANKAGGIKPISFALSNALIKTTPVDDFYLLGKLLPEDNINEGIVAMNCPMYFLLPSLPDPYVTTYQPFNYRGQDKASNSVNSHISLAPIVQWAAPNAARLSFLFVPDNTTSDVFAILENNFAANKQPTDRIAVNKPNDAVSQTVTSYSKLMAVNSTAEIQQQDASNTAALRAIFDSSLNTSGESIYLLDVSTNADLFGVGLGFNRNKHEQLNPNFPLAIIGIDLVTDAFNTRIYTLPQIQWEPLWTVQNPDVVPYPFPSPATSPDTGDPTIIGTTSYELVPIAPKPVIDNFLTTYNDSVHPQKMAALFSLPFGMKAAAVLDNPSDPTKPGATVSYNEPAFDDQKLQGGLQITVFATSPEIGTDKESPELKGATIQTRNLIDLFGGNIPLGLSVLGPVVDTIFNGEFKPAGANPRVPLERMDLSGYGATIFSNWLNPAAAIAATSQARFDVLIGRTSHEVIQVKSILYPWGIAVVRTITIQRTSGGGVTRYDSGWKAQGPGVYDFSYTDTAKVKHANPYVFHPGIVKGIYNVTEIRDTGRTYEVDAPDPLDSVIMQEVFFNGDALIEDVAVGAFNGFVPSKKQRGFVQLAPYQKPLTPQQFSDLIDKEGALGGPVDCVVNVGQSGQTMRVVRIDVSNADRFGSKLFVSTGHGSLALPKEGAWSQVKRQENATDIISLDEDDAFPIIREGPLNTIPTQPYRFADPADIVSPGDPKSDYALLHSMGSQKVLYLRPTIQRNDANIKSTFQPLFADCYALINSKSIFPPVDTTFPIGGNTNLQVLSEHQLKLTSGGNYKVPSGYQRNMVNVGTSRIYIDYSDVAEGSGTTDVNYFFDSSAAIPWKANLSKVSTVTDLLSLTGITSFTTEFDAASNKNPEVNHPKLKFGSILQPIMDVLSFLGGFDMADVFKVNMNNSGTWQTKFNAAMVVELEFKVPSELEVKVAHHTVSKTGVAAPEPSLILGAEVTFKEYFQWAKSGTALDFSGQPVSSGAKLEIEGTIHILISAPFYGVGILGVEFEFDEKEGNKTVFKIAVGIEIRMEIAEVIEAAVLLALGIEHDFSSGDNAVLMILKAEAEILGGIIAVGFSIEAKGGQKSELIDAIKETFAITEVELALDISICFVIHFEIDTTWQEKRHVSSGTP